VRAVETGQFVNDSVVSTLNLGMGHEVFFAGRFINAEGMERNRPSVRFGNIAQTETQLIDGEESYLVEARSIPGYSGSPVFVYVLAGTAHDIRSDKIWPRSYGPFLLGVDWCHINDYVDAKDEYGNKLPFKIRSNSGMMGVVPARKLLDLLYTQEMVDMRHASKKTNRAATPDVAVAPERTSAPSSSDANPKHREDFTRLVNAAARKPEPRD
jgi:hypothetical protein